MDDSGTLHSEQQDIKDVATHFFKSFYEANQHLTLQEQVHVAQLYPHTVTLEDSANLDSPCTLQEVLLALKSFNTDRSPGPDGWTVEFYLHFFDLIGPDLLDFVEDSRQHGKVTGAVNSTFLTLIPKENHPANFGDYRPIALCNLCYKLITKIIANRIKPILSRTLSAEQLGFLKGCQILDDVGAAQECLHNIKQKNTPALILKLDLKKSFDCLDWNFLRLILIQFGFSHNLIKWIMGCITSANFAVLVNGEPSTFFHSGRGLRQGCPLSPLLFILAMEGLSLLLKKSQADGKLTGIKVSRLVKILHLFFVDDVLIMTSATLTEWTAISDILKSLCSASGLQINWTKSTFHFANVQEQNLDLLKAIFPHTFVHLSTGFKYLGYFIKADRYRASDWDWLITKVGKKIGHWCNRWLTIGGRYTLLKSVLEGQPIYWMALAAIPIYVLEKLRKLSYNFLWSGSKDQHNFHLCNWEHLAKPKHKGGWGIRHIFKFNIALAANSLWRALTSNDIWSMIIKDKYLPFSSVATWLRSGHPIIRNASRTWRNLTSSVHWITRGLCWKPGSGHTINIGTDCIIGLGGASTLPPPLIQHLNRHNTWYLYQARLPCAPGNPTGGWKSSSQLDIPPNLSEDWNQILL
jgi:hypothetical protein